MIKYECDNCGEEVYTVEAIGPGVYQSDTGQDMKGKMYEYYPEEENQLVLHISLSNKQGGDHQYCYACMWHMLAQMIGSKMPINTLAEVLMKSEGEKTQTIRQKYIVDKFRVKEWHHPYEPVQWHTDVEEVPNVDESDGVAVTDSELSQLRSQGHLPESGPDVPADDPGVHNPTGIPGIPNYDPGPTPEAAWAKPWRPGWQY